MLVFARGLQPTAVILLTVLLGIKFGCAELIGSAYADCKDNFTTLERALFETGDNRFQIISTFYPARESVLLYAHANYYFCENITATEQINCTEPEEWRWTTGSFYFVQAPSVLRFTSLFFVYPEGRIGELSIHLPAECKDVSRTRQGHGPGRQEGMLEILTQRLKFYGQYNSLEYIVITEYTGFFAKAIPKNELHTVYGNPVGGYDLIMFYILTALLPLVMVSMMLFVFKSSRVTLKRNFTNPRCYPTFASLIAIGVLFSLFVIGMDICAMVWAWGKHNEWTGVVRDPGDVASFVSIVVTLILDCICVLVGAIFMVIGFRCKCCCYQPNPEANPEANSKVATQVNRMWWLYLSFIAPVGCFGTHVGYMVVGWLTDPRHGGAVFVIYAFSFIYYFAFGKMVYRYLEDRIYRRKEGEPNDNPETELLAVIEIDHHKNKYNTVPSRAGMFSFGYLITVIVLEVLPAGLEAYAIGSFAELPLIGAVEETPQYLLSLFQVAVLVATIVLTYKYLTADPPIERELLSNVIENMNYLKRLPGPQPPSQQQQILLILQQQQRQHEQLLLFLQQQPPSPPPPPQQPPPSPPPPPQQQPPSPPPPPQQPPPSPPQQQQQQQQLPPRPRTDTEVLPPRPRTDTEVQKVAAILGAVGHKFLFESVPPEDCADQNPLSFLGRENSSNFETSWFPKCSCCSAHPPPPAPPPRQQGEEAQLVINEE